MPYTAIAFAAAGKISVVSEDHGLGNHDDRRVRGLIKTNFWHCELIKNRFLPAAAKAFTVYSTVILKVFELQIFEHGFYCCGRLARQCKLRRA